jgi:hypothetical protein
MCSRHPYHSERFSFVPDLSWRSKRRHPPLRPRPMHCDNAAKACTTGSLQSSQDPQKPCRCRKCGGIPLVIVLDRFTAPLSLIGGVVHVGEKWLNGQEPWVFMEVHAYIYIGQRKRPEGVRYCLRAIAPPTHTYCNPMRGLGLFACTGECAASLVPSSPV